MYLNSSKLTIEIANFELISQIVLSFPLLILNKSLLAGLRWISKWLRLNAKYDCQEISSTEVAIDKAYT